MYCSTGIKTCIRSSHNTVVGLHVQGTQRYSQRIRAVGHRHTMAYAYVTGEFGFKAHNLLAQHIPVPLQHPQDCMLDMRIGIHRSGRKEGNRDRHD